MNKFLTTIAVIIGVLLVVLAFVYWFTPANALPSYLPGYDPTLTKVHLKHGIGAFILALGAFAFVWFRTGKKSKNIAGQL